MPVHGTDYYGYILDFFNILSYWSPGITQLLPLLDQVKPLILAYGSIPDQVTIYQSYSLYNLPHSGPYNLTLSTSTSYDHFTTTMVDISLSGAWLIIVAPSLPEYHIYVYSCFYSSEKKLWLGWIPIGYNHSSKLLSTCPLSCSFNFVGFDGFNYLSAESSQHRSVENSFTKKNHFE